MDLAMDVVERVLAVVAGEWGPLLVAASDGVEGVVQFVAVAVLVLHSCSCCCWDVI